MPTNPQSREKLIFDQLRNEQLESLKRFSYLLLNRWYYIVAGAAIGLSLAFLATWYLVPQYQTHMQVVKQSENKPNIALPTIPGMEEFSRNSSVNLEYEKSFFNSKPSLLHMFDRLGLDVSYYVQQGMRKRMLYGERNPLRLTTDTASKERPADVSLTLNLDEAGKGFTLYTEDEDWAPVLDGKSFVLGQWQEAGGWRFRVDYRKVDTALEDGKPIQAFSLQIHDRDKLVRKYKERINISLLEDRRTGENPVTVLALDVKAPSKQQGIDILNALYEEGQRKDINEKHKSLSKTIAFIEGQLQQITDSLGLASNQIHRIKLQNKNVALGSNDVFSRVLKLEEERKQLMMAAKYYTYLKQYVKSNAKGQLMTPSSFGVESQALNSMLTRYIEVKLEAQGDMGDLASRSPLYKLEKDTQQRAVRTMEEGILSTIDNQTRALNFQVAEMDEEMKRLLGRADNVLYQEKAYEDFSRLFKLNESLFNVLLQKKAEASISLASAVSDYSIVEDPEADEDPVYPNKPLSYLIGLLLGMLVPVGLLYARHRMDDKVKTQEELERLCGLPVLGMVAKSPKDVPIVMEGDPKSSAAESIRGIRANLRDQIGGHGDCYTLMFTSSISGEGKSFVSLNVAASFALLGKKAIILDCDLRKPRLHTVLNMSNSAGMSDYLEGSLAMEEMIRDTGVENLSIILAGNILPNSIELLSNSRMEALMAYLKAHYDVVVIDSPPVGLVADAKMLYRYSDSIMMISRYDYTPITLVSDMKEHFSEKELGRVSVLFNAVDIHGRYSKYGKYGYGSYYANDEDGKHKSKVEILREKIGV